MSYTPTTFADLAAWQLTVQNEVQIGGSSPFPLMTANDAALYGATLTFGTDVAIFIGVPKDLKTLYPYQCWLTPLSENVYRKTLGGYVFDEIEVAIVVAGNWTTNAYAVQKQIYAIRDVFETVIAKHAEQPNAAEVVGAKWGASGSSGSHGFYMLEEIGYGWYCWRTTRWMRRQWIVQGNVQQ
jgi:hypothetical protein